MVRAALSGALDDAEFTLDKRFRVWVPEECPGVPPEILRPEATWRDKGTYERQADGLAEEFAREFARSFGGMGINPRVAAQCPGRR